MTQSATRAREEITVRVSVRPGAVRVAPARVSVRPGEVRVMPARVAVRPGVFRIARSPSSTSVAPPAVRRAGER